MHMPLQSFMPAFARTQANRTSRLLLSLSLAAVGMLTSVTARAQTFGNVAMGGGGFVSGLVMSHTQANLMYARTDVGGAYRWDATSSRWIPLLDWVSTAETGYMGAEAIALDPHNSNNVYMLVGTSYFNGGKTAILRSTNQGATFAITDVTSQFKAHGNGMGRNTGEKLAVDPNDGTILLCGTRANGLFRSTNSGVSWTHVGGLNVSTTANGNGISLVIFDPASGTTGSATQTVVVGVSQTGTNLFRSNDGGNTFSAISGAPTTLMPQRAALTPDRNLIITYANGAGPFGTTAEPMNTGQIWKYNIQSGAWTNLTPAGNTLPFSGISVDPKNANRMIASTINTYHSQGSAFGDQFFLTTNGGASWTNVVARGFSIDSNGVTWMTPNQSIHWAGSIQFDPFNTSRVFVNSGNGVFMTENIDAVPTVWKFDVRGLEETVSNDLVSVPGGPVITVIGDFDGFVNANINNYGPQHTPRMGSTQGLAVAALNPNRVARAGSAFYISNDMGASWTKGTINGAQGRLALSANGNTILHTPSGSGTTFRSTDSGGSWTAVTGLNVSGVHPAADQVNSSKFYAYAPSSGAFFVSTDGGASFAQSTTLPTGGSLHIRTVPGNEGHIWVALYGGGLRRSTNSGQTFTSVSTVSSCGAVGLGKAAPGASYPTVYIWGTVGGVEGLHRSTDQGATWTRINDDAHEWGGTGNGQYVIGDVNVFGRVYMSTVGRGVVYIDSAGGSTSVSVTGVSVSPATLSVAVGATAPLGATVTPSNATNKTVSWSSSNTAVATVSSSGVVTGVSAGTATVTATTVDGGKTASAAVTVTSTTIPVTGVTVSPTTASVAVGSTTALTATVAPANATVKTVTWTSSDTAVATVNGSGVVTGVAAGSATVTATTQDGSKTASSAITVTTSTIPVTGVTVSPTTASIAVGATTALTATVAPANATNKTVTWSSSAPAVATVSATGVVTGVSAGSATITATAQGGATASSAITVTGGTTGGGTCSNPTAITLSFAKDGAGEFCFVTSGTVNFINSWNLQLLEINGVNLTNKWANTLPARINGNYYIHYIGNFPWSHFEANGK